MHYNHIILTRFNLQYEADSNIHLEPGWLDERFRLFERYCLPSIVGQTKQTFTWVILASEQTPDVYRKRLTEYAAEHGNIAIHFCPYYEDINQLYIHIGQQYSLGYTHLLSTRVDSDDMLAYDFVETLQSYISDMTTDHAILTFADGVQWFEHKNIALAASYKKNHFLSFYEPSKALRTCIGIDHTKVPDLLLRLLPDKGMWCEIVHRSNMCNGYVPKYHYRCSVQQHQYPISLTDAKKHEQCMFIVREHLRFRLRQVGRMVRRLIPCHTS